METVQSCRTDATSTTTVFDAVASRDLEGIIVEYIQNARDTIVSYLSMKKRWRCEQTQGECGHFQV
jgi:hypothetical protein